jgi:hypothetical protein
MFPGAKPQPKPKPPAALTISCIASSGSGSSPVPMVARVQMMVGSKEQQGQGATDTRMLDGMACRQEQA